MSDGGYITSPDFKLVTYRRKGASPAVKTSGQVEYTTIGTSASQEALIRRIQSAKEEIKISDLFASAVASLREGLEALSQPKLTEIVCFGLGKIGECTISRFQLAFLLCLRELYGIGVSVYDPVFSNVDLDVLKHFSCKILDRNIEGKFEVRDKLTRIFYLPHCPKQLSNNLLWANWGCNLNYCIIFANSFNLIVESTGTNELSKAGQYIGNILPYVVELPLINSFRLFEIFNDTAIHVFPWKKLRLLDDNFWLLKPEPKYLDDVEFIIDSK